MHAAPLPEDEQERLDELKALNILDTDFEQAYDDLTQLAGKICQAPIALISLLDEKRQWFKAVTGLGVRETSRDLAFCAHAIVRGSPFIVSDAARDERFSDNPLVTGDPNIRFYAGIPLVTAKGHALGTLCAIDRKPRELTQDQLDALKILAGQVVRLFELRAKNIALEKSNQQKAYILSIVAHDLRSPLGSLLGLSSLLRENWKTFEDAEVTEALEGLADSAASTLALANNLLLWAETDSGQLQPHLRQVPLEDLFKEVAQQVEGLVRAKNLQLKVVCPNGLWAVGDPMFLRSILSNLVGNAIKFCRPGGKIEMIAQNGERKRVMLSVQDDGVGMSERQLQAWERESVLESSQGTSGEWGTGLGLRLARLFAHRLGSELKIQSRTEGGTKFFMELSCGEVPRL
ncbi:MAG: GAF domain-containing sensor histidine kinase [Spirochaetales bacterium]|nr:GAF domain-containing sensor histidine kinase [Spirochaetales bacterium]